MVEALEGKDDGEEFQVVSPVSLLSGGESGGATADEEPGILVGLHEAETNVNLGCISVYETQPVQNK